MDIALLVARLIIGLGMAVHGAQKVFGWFGGPGLRATGGMFDGMGFRPGGLFALLAGGGEVGSGALIALGLLGPVGPALMILVMTVAIFGVHWKNGFLVMNNGYELPLLYSAAALVLAFWGPGAYSVDALLSPTWKWTPASIWLLVAAAVAFGFVNLALRRPPAPKPTTASS
jgi:putative oxidoreductase